MTYSNKSCDLYICGQFHLSSILMISEEDKRTKMMRALFLTWTQYLLVFFTKPFAYIAVIISRSLFSLKEFKVFLPLTFQSAAGRLKKLNNGP